MNFKVVILISSFPVLLSSAALADGTRPQDFTDDRGNKIVFADFKEIQCELEFDVKTKTAKFFSKIQFETTSAGNPIFDLVDEPEALELDGKKVDQVLTDSPDKNTKFRVLTRVIQPGIHVLKIAGQIKMNVEFETDGAKSGFWMTDLKDRGYLERYLPSNFDYDQYLMKLAVTVAGTKRKHIAIANGEAVQSTKPNQFGFVFPETYTTSSVFFHLAPEDSLEVVTSQYSSKKTGIKTPVTIYKKKESTEKLAAYLLGALTALEDLEKTYGPYLHPSLIVYAAGEGGMEHAGATLTSLEALSHEVAHSWFGRGMIPSGGDAGWLDEAITSWRDQGFYKKSNLNQNRPMADHGQYNRTTDVEAYGFGADFIASLHAKVPNFFEFLQHVFKTKAWKPMTTQEFSQELSEFTKADFNSVFKKFVYRLPGESVNRAMSRRQRTPAKPNRFHPELTPEQMRRLL